VYVPAGRRVFRVASVLWCAGTRTYGSLVLCFLTVKDPLIISARPCIAHGHTAHCTGASRSMIRISYDLGESGQTTTAARRVSGAQPSVAFGKEGTSTYVTENIQYIQVRVTWNMCQVTTET
jgi:hypothetical protein